MTRQRKRILLDLKPAFDGYSGIPQETRLLFSGLRQEPGWDVKGLIQHGARRLRRAVVPGSDVGGARRVYELSKVIVSLNERPHGGVWDGAAEAVNKYLSLELLRMRVALGVPVRPSVFDSRLFPDFIWRTFFDKTLHARDKERIATDDYLLLEPSRKQFQSVGLRSARWAAAARFPQVDLAGFDYFIAQTPFPGRISRGTQLVVRYHDAVPLLMPHTIKDKAVHQATHYHALRSNIASGAVFCCVSQASRRDLLTIFPDIEPVTSVIHNMVSQDYFPEETDPRLVGRLVRHRLADNPMYAGAQADAAHSIPDTFDYLLTVSTLEPRKNHALLLHAWERLKHGTHPGLKLVLVGNAGWDDKPILKALKPWVQKGEVYHLENVPAQELRTLYRHASATVCPSYAEGFDFPGVEAMRCGCPVVASDIPVHREVYGDAAAYFDPYSADDAAAQIRHLIGDPDRRMRHADSGLAISQRYAPAAILPQWVDFFERLQAIPTGGSAMR